MNSRTFTPVGGCKFPTGIGHQTQNSDAPGHAQDANIYGSFSEFNLLLEPPCPT